MTNSDETKTSVNSLINRKQLVKSWWDQFKIGTMRRPINRLIRSGSQLSQDSDKTSR